MDSTTGFAWTPSTFWHTFCSGADYGATREGWRIDARREENRPWPNTPQSRTHQPLNNG